MVHQHFMLIPVMTVAENIVLADEPRTAASLLDYGEPRTARARARRQRFGLAVDPDARIEDISVGQQQRVEILKALYRERRHPHPRRADRGADAAGGAASCSRSCAADGARACRSSSSATSSTRCSRSPTGSPCSRRGKMVDTVAARGRDRGRAGAADGRPRGAPARRQGARRSRASRCWRSRA